jgi:hypothetical protein
MAGRQGAPVPAFPRLADSGYDLLIRSMVGASGANRFATAFQL